MSKQRIKELTNPRALDYEVQSHVRGAEMSFRHEFKSMPNFRMLEPSIVAYADPSHPGPGMKFLIEAYVPFNYPSDMPEKDVVKAIKRRFEVEPQFSGRSGMVGIPSTEMQTVSIPQQKKDVQADIEAWKRKVTGVLERLGLEVDERQTMVVVQGKGLDLVLWPRVYFRYQEGWRADLDRKEKTELIGNAVGATPKQWILNSTPGELTEIAFPPIKWPSRLV